MENINNHLNAREAWAIIKWSIMVAGLFWMFVFRLSEQAEKLPDFIYVQF